MDSLLSNKITVYIVSKYGTKEKSTLRLSEHDPNSETYIIWREGHAKYPSLSCKISSAKSISAPVLSPSSYTSTITLLFPQVKLTVELYHESFSPNDEHALPARVLQVYNELKQAWQHSLYISNLQKDRSGLSESNIFSFFDNQDSLACLHQEQALQLTHSLRAKESYSLIDKAVDVFRGKVYAAAFSHWVRVVREVNNDKMLQ